MIKLIGALLMIGTFASAGFSFSLRLKHRAELLSAMISALEMIKSEIFFKLTPLPELMVSMKSQCDNRLAPFFTELSDAVYTRQEDGFYTIWKECLLQLSALDKGDIQILRDTGRMLGRYGAEEQSEVISYAIRRLELRLKSAESDCEQKGRLYRTLGAGLGFLAVLFVL